MKRSRAVRNIVLGVKNLSLHRMRSLLTTLGVVFGVASVIAMLAVGEGASRQALDQIRKLGSNNILLSSVKPARTETQGSSGTSRMSVYGLLRDDARRIEESMAAVVRLVPVRLRRKGARFGERLVDVRVVGTTADWFDLVQRPLLAGRTFTAADEDAMAPVCVVAESVARRLLAGESAIGNHIVVGKHSFEVIGVVQTEGDNPSGQFPDRASDLYIPISVSIARFGEIIFERNTGSFQIEKVELHQLLLEIDLQENVLPTSLAVKGMLQRFHANEDYAVSVPLTLLRQAEATKRTFNIVLGSIAGISLLVGGIGIMNIMLATVTERTREIGIRRAIGAKQRQIVAQFLVETVVLSGAGGMIGLALGVLIPLAITRFAGMPTVILPGSIVLALGISMSIGVVFGLYPAFRAASLDPIQALRHE